MGEWGMDGTVEAIVDGEEGTVLIGLRRTAVGKDGRLKGSICGEWRLRGYAEAVRTPDCGGSCSEQVAVIA
jgi:hypothetical protein